MAGLLGLGKDIYSLWNSDLPDKIHFGKGWVCAVGVE